MTIDASPEAIRRRLTRKALESERHRVVVGSRIGLDHTQMTAVVRLAEAGELTPAELGDALLLTSGGVTALIQRLERFGHVSRRPHPNDRRSVLLRATPTILERAERLYLPLVNGLDNIATSFGEEKRVVIAEYLDSALTFTERTVVELRTEPPASDSVRRHPSPGLWA